MTVVDSHVHLLPGRLGEKVRRFFLQGMAAADFAYPTHHGVVLDRLAAEGVDVVWHLPYTHRPGVASGLNEAAATAADDAASGTGPGASVTVVPGCTVHPDDDAPLDIVRRAVEDLGARVLKIHCSVGDHDSDHPALDPVWHYVSEVRLPTVVHVGHSVLGSTEGDELSPVDRTATRFPEAPVVLAHTAHPATAAALALLDAHPSVHADLTPVVRQQVDLDAEALERHADRLLFGSDAPNTAITAGAGLAHLRSLDLSPAALAAITGGTAERLRAGVRA